jgi:hypothetical protein
MLPQTRPVPTGSVLMVAVMAASMFGGCGSKSPGASSPAGGRNGGATGAGGQSANPTRSGGSGGGVTSTGSPGGSGGTSPNTGGTTPVGGTGGQTTPPGSGGNSDTAPPNDVRAPGDATTTETAPPDVATAACSAPALLCEDFENITPGSNLGPTWTIDQSGGTLTVDTTRPFAGTKGLHIKANANASSLLQIVKQGAPLFPVAKNAFFGRMMIWITQQPTGAVHFNTVQANGLLPGSALIGKYAYGAMYGRYMAGYTVRTSETASPTIDCGKSGTAGYPEKSWVCAEWQFDGPNNEMHYWINGQAQTSVDVIKVGGGCTGTQPAGGVWQAPAFNKLMIGWYAQPFPSAIDVWIDDIVVSTERVGCPKP